MAGLLAAFVFASAVVPAAAQPTLRRAEIPPLPRPSASDNDGDLLAHFGVEKARRLLRSQDPDERLRGIERAAGLGTPEALALLVEQLDLSAATRTDARAKIAIARGLAEHTDRLVARAALIQLMDLASPRSSPQKPETEDPAYAPRLEVARSIAALALAQSGEPHAVESVVAVARGSSAGAGAATAALVAYPPSSSSTWAKPMSAAMARLVDHTGDLRAAGSLLDVARGTSAADAAMRGAAIAALGALGDGRVLEIARGSLDDDDPRVRIAATKALAALGAPEAARAVEQLLADDGTAGYGIELAMTTHGVGVVHALAARAAIAADLAVRSAALAALGRDPTPDGTEALAALIGDPMLRADGADAMARSPSPASMGAIEHLATSPASRRLAARAYVVRALTRGESSAAMERTLAELTRSSDGRDRALGVFAQIVLGETDAARWLGDANPLVRREAAMATMRFQDGAGSRVALLVRRSREEDAPTRSVLGLGLLGGDEGGLISTQALRACARGGESDVPLCTLALARRATEADSTEVDALLSSPDAIVRAHAARGLAESEDPARGGRLAAAYAYEPDPLVRRSILLAAAPLSTAPGIAPGLADTIAMAARLDPDPEIRWVAARLATFRPLPAGDEAQIAWIHLVDASGAPPRAGVTAALLRADGLAIPIVFDGDGDALVPGVPPGSARLILAPRLDAAYSGAR